MFGDFIPPSLSCLLFIFFSVTSCRMLLSCLRRSLVKAPILPQTFSCYPEYSRFAAITVTWSLSYEFFFYLSVPILVILTRMRYWAHRARIALFLCLFAVHGVGYWFGIIPHIRLSMFFTGMTVYEVLDAGWLADRLGKTSELVAIGLYLATLAFLGLFEFSDRRPFFHPFFPNAGFVGWTFLLSLSLFGVLTSCFTFNGLLNRFFTYFPLRWIGNISYSYFLVHGVVLNGMLLLIHSLGVDRVRSVTLFMTLLMFNLAFTISTALILFIFVERPLSLRVTRRHVPPRTMTAAAGSRQ